jgi:predicted HTH transcriptional regulator
LEVWNPGELPSTLTLGDLRLPHASVPRNPLIFEPMFLAHYAEKAGSGILDMISRCQKAGLPEPEFKQSGGQFVQTIWRDWLTADKLTSMELNERQKATIAFIKTNTQMSNIQYKELFGVSKPTATRDLNQLCRQGILQKVGHTGKGTYYVLNREGLIKGSKGSTSSKGSQRAQRAHTDLLRKKKKPRRY